MKEPTGPERLSAVWWTLALREHGTLGQERVTSCDVRVLDGTKRALGQIARVALTYDGQETDATRSLIAKFPAATLDVRSLLDRFRFYTREVRSYRGSTGYGDAFATRTRGLSNY